MKFGLMFFASSEDALAGEKYSLVLESARFADQHGFSSVWTPERHFTQFGGLYPNPAVLNAALAQITQRIRLQAGSVVMPLHHPLALAESWAMVDNLSGGRVGISLASGWNPNDFAWCAEVYEQRRQVLFDHIATLQKLWRGETISVTNGKGEPTEVRIYPTPIQPQIPLWITAASHPQTFAQAGAIGANLLTHLLDQGIEPLAEKIALYRHNRAKHGHNPDTGVVSLMLHTFVGQNFDKTCNQARKPYCDYLKANIGLLKSLAQSRGQTIDFETLPERDLDAFVNFLFDRFATSRGLIGDPDSCLDLLAALDEIGVDEAACLLDFGPSKPVILEHLPDLNQLRERYSKVETKRPRINANGSNGAAISVAALTDWSDSALVNGVEQAAAEREALERETADLETVRQRCQGRHDAQKFYQLLAERGLQLGETYRGIQQLWLGRREVLAQVNVPPAAVAARNSLQVYAPVLDACHQVLGATLLSDPGAGGAGNGGGSNGRQGTGAGDSGGESEEPDSLYLPVGLNRFEVRAPLGAAAWSHAILRRVSGANQEAIAGDIRIFNPTGELAIEVLGLQMQRAHPMTAATEHAAAPGTDWLYELQWRAAPLAGLNPQKQPPSGHWIIFSDRKGIGAALAARLQALGNRCDLIYWREQSDQGTAHQRTAHQGTADLGFDPGAIAVDPTDAAALQELLHTRLSPEQPPCCGVIHLWSLDAAPSPTTTLASLQGDQALTVTSLLHLVQALIATASTSGVSTPASAPPPRLWAVTEDVQKVGGETTPRSLAQAPTWGLGRVAATEYPQLWGGLIDLDSTAAIQDTIEQLLQQLLPPSSGDAPEDQVALRAGQRHILRLVRSPRQPPSTSIGLRPDATYLITGGLGHLGLASAQWLAARGAKSLALIGRRAPSEQALAAIATLEKTGVQVQALQADVADEAAMAAAIAQIQAAAPPLKGIFHSAGASQQKAIPAITAADLTAMLRPKVWGAWNLHQLTREEDLDFFFSTSSMSPIFGSQGLGHYAAANYFLDVFAHYRQDLGLPSLTVNVGALAGGGMALAAPEAEKYTRQIGLNLTAPGDLLDVAGRFLLVGEEDDSTPSPVANLIVADMDWSIFKPLYESTTGKPLLADVGQEATGQTWGQRDPFWRQLEDAPGGDRLDQIVAYLQREVANTLGYGEGKPLFDPDRGFFEMGMDSLMAVGLKNKLETSLATALPTVLIFEHPNVWSLANYIAVEVLGWRTGPAAELTPPDAVSPAADLSPEPPSQIQALSEQTLTDLINQKLVRALEEDSHG